MSKHYDAVICGGGLAGLTLARQLRAEFSDISVAVIEKTQRPLPLATHKVGESSVELGSNYLERLGLRDYLHENHLIKFGLRFFPGRGDEPIHARTEIGPINEPVISSYQIDRGRFESDLREMADTDEGIDLIEGAKVRDIQIESGETNNRIVYETDDAGETEVSARWVIDATGRTALLRSRLKLKRGVAHEANAGWFRVKGRIDIAKMADETQERWHRVPDGERRWLSTNHLMGEGYWVWVIPLSSGMTSIGAVVHDHVHDFDTVRTLERVQEFLRKYEPDFAEFLSDAEVMDFGCLKRYSHTVTRCWHPDRWALVGEAGAFSDPLYSPGTDYIALANTFTTEMIRADREGGDVAYRSAELNAQYKSLVSGSVGVYRESAAVYGHAQAMATKIYWDNMVYWSYPCQYFIQDVFKLSKSELEPYTDVGARFLEMSGQMQHILRFWAQHVPSEEPKEGQMVVVPGYPSVLIDAHCALGEKMSLEDTLEYMKEQLTLTESLFGEIVLRVAQQLGPELTAKMYEEVGIGEWNVSLSDERLEAEGLSGHARKRALPELVRDVERSLGATAKRWDAIEAAHWINAQRQPARAV